LEMMIESCCYVADYLRADPAHSCQLPEISKLEATLDELVLRRGMMRTKGGTPADKAWLGIGERSLARIFGT
jgi:hypothetical protein